MNRRYSIKKFPKNVQEFIENSDVQEYKTKVKGILVFCHADHEKHICYIFKGRRHLPQKCIFGSEMEMYIYIDKEIKVLYDKNEHKRKSREYEKVQKKEQIDKIQIGDIYYTSWGYNMTLVDFFEVVGKPTPANVTIRPIEKEAKNNSYADDEVKALPGTFFGKAKNVQVNSSGSLVNADEYNHNAYPDSGKWHYTNHMD